MIPCPPSKLDPLMTSSDSDTVSDESQNDSSGEDEDEKVSLADEEEEKENTKIRMLIDKFVQEYRITEFTSLELPKKVPYYDAMIHHINKNNLPYLVERSKESKRVRSGFNHFLEQAAEENPEEYRRIYASFAKNDLERNRNNLTIKYGDNLDFTSPNLPTPIPKIGDRVMVYDTILYSPGSRDQEYLDSSDMNYYHTAYAKGVVKSITSIDSNDPKQNQKKQITIHPIEVFDRFDEKIDTDQNLYFRYLEDDNLPRQSIETGKLKEEIMKYTFIEYKYRTSNEMVKITNHGFRIKIIDLDDVIHPSISGTINSTNEYGAITIKDINLCEYDGLKKIDFKDIQEAYLGGDIDKKKLNEIKFQFYYLDLEPEERTIPNASLVHKYFFSADNSVFRMCKSMFESMENEINSDRQATELVINATESVEGGYGLLQFLDFLKLRTSSESNTVYRLLETSIKMNLNDEQRKRMRLNCHT